MGLVASTISLQLVASGLDPREQLGDAQVVGIHAVDRRERAAEDVVQPAVLGRPLERLDVGGRLDDADQAAVATRVEADHAALALGQVEAVDAEA